MAHIPVNHHLQPLYRVVAFLGGLYVFLFGVVAVVRVNGHSMFARSGLPQVLGLRANRAFAIVSVVAGIVIIAGALIGRNVDHWVNLIGGIVFLVSGFAMMTLLRTNMNILGFTMTTCVVSFCIGTVLFTAGLYGKTGTQADVRREEAFRHGGGTGDLGANGASS